MDLALKINDARICQTGHCHKNVISDVSQHLFVDRSIRGGFVLHRDRILEINKTGKDIDEKSKAVFLDVTSLYLLAIFHFSLPCWNHR